MEDIPLTWIILAGGASVRMGQPKQLLPWKTGTLLDAALEKASRANAAQILVSAQKDCGTCRCYPDLIPNAGPLGGIYTCLHHARQDLCMVLPVDIPLFPESLVPEMARYALENNCDYLPLCWNGLLEPAVAIVRRRALGTVGEMLHRGQFQLRQLLEQVPSDVFCREGDPMLLYNCNTREQYACLRQYLHEG